MHRIEGKRDLPPCDSSGDVGQRGYAGLGSPDALNAVRESGGDGTPWSPVGGVDTLRDHVARLLSAS